MSDEFGSFDLDLDGYGSRRRELLIRRLEAAAYRKQAQRRWWRRLRGLLRLFNPYR